MTAPVEVVIRLANVTSLAEELTRVRRGSDREVEIRKAIDRAISDGVAALTGNPTDGTL